MLAADAALSGALQQGSQIMIAGVSLSVLTVMLKWPGLTLLLFGAIDVL